MFCWPTLGINKKVVKKLCWLLDPLSRFICPFLFVVHFLKPFLFELPYVHAVVLGFTLYFYWVFFFKSSVSVCVHVLCISRRVVQVTVDESVLKVQSMANVRLWDVAVYCVSLCFKSLLLNIMGIESLIVITLKSKRNYRTLAYRSFFNIQVFQGNSKSLDLFCHFCLSCLTCML